jgi:outer membrane immunogenic protein
MRRLGLGLLATTALATCGAEALAGSPGVNPPYLAPAVPWVGWYAGVNIGGSWARAQTDFAITGFLSTTIGASDSLTGTGVIGGGQIGYNWLVDPNWLIGAEADIQGSGAKASATRFDTADGEGVTTNYQAKIDWFGTVRGRVGYVYDRRILLYATGGLAYGNVSVSGTSIPALGSPVAFSNSDVNVGWTVGAGVEGMAWDPRWTWKVEYLYLDLGSLDSAVATSFIRTHATTNFTDQIVRAGLNFHY